MQRDPPGSVQNLRAAARARCDDQRVVLLLANSG